MGRRKIVDKTAIAYIRVSTADQRLGADAQQASLDQWATREGITIIATFIDEGVSGGADIEARPGLVTALTQLKATKAATLIIAKRDRLARDTFIAMSIERAVESLGARVVCADGIANGDGPADMLLRTILDAVATYERSLIRGRTRVALATKRARGECAGTLPYGVRLASDGLHVEDNPDEQAVITQICQLRKSGLTQRAIVVECRRIGLASRSGRSLNQTQISRILRRSNEQQ